MINLPESIQNNAQKTTESLLPVKSKAKYEKE
jgi:hypothetical protein